MKYYTSPKWSKPQVKKSHDAEGLPAPFTPQTSRQTSGQIPNYLLIGDSTLYCKGTPIFARDQQKGKTFALELIPGKNRKTQKFRVEKARPHPMLVSRKAARVLLIHQGEMPNASSNNRRNLATPPNWHWRSFSSVTALSTAKGSRNYNFEEISLPRDFFIVVVAGSQRSGRRRFRRVNIRCEVHWSFNRSSMLSLHHSSLDHIMQPLNHGRLSSLQMVSFNHARCNHQQSVMQSFIIQRFNQERGFPWWFTIL